METNEQFPSGVERLSRGWTLLDAIDDVVDALNDLAPLLRGERSGGHINLRDWHGRSSFSITT